MQFASVLWQRMLGSTAKAMISALLLSFILFRVDFTGVCINLAAASISRLTLAFAAFLLIPFLGGLRWWLALRGIGERARLLKTIALFSVAAVAGQVLPSVAGDGVRVWLAVRSHHGIRAAVQSVLLERAFMILAVLALALATAPLLDARTGYSGPVWLSAALFVFCIGGFAMLLTADHAPHPLGGLRSWRILADGAEAARCLTLSWWGACLAGISLLGNLNFALAAFLLGGALDVRATAWDMIAIMPAVTLATTLPISLGGWGVREGMMVLLLGRLGVPTTEALSLALLFGVFGMVSGVPGVLAWAFGWWRGEHVASVPTGLRFLRVGE